ncbi:MAG: hypothetical protein NC127_00540 [Muribaculum sp.]|nr:hypothetical protein [Muribaculum sp.]
MNIVKKILVAVAVILAVGNVSAQDAMSPYSKYGYGILNDNATSAQSSMGGIGYAMQSGRQVNVMNPASYASIDSITFLFDMGMDLTKLWSRETDNKGVSHFGSSFGGGFDYITMQFPISKYIGASLGMIPYSNVGYAFGSSIDNGSETRQGSGGLNQLYAGVAGRIFKGFSLGVNIGYLFGTTYNDTYLYTSTGSSTLFETVVEVRDYHIQFGAQYAYNINKDSRLTAGVTFSPGKSLLGHAWGVHYDLSTDSEMDTVGYTSLKNKYSLPASWGFGVNYQWRDRWMVELDLTYQPWSKAKYRNIDDALQSQSFDDRWKLAAGMQYTPNTRGSYVQNINYRAGAFYEHGYLNVMGNNVREYGASIGFGLPAPKQKTVINLGFEWRHRQATPNPLIKENYFSIKIGVNFNERWFYQRKIQ